MQQSTSITPLTSTDLAEENIKSTLDWFFETLDKEAAVVRLMGVVYEQREAAEVEMLSRLKKFCTIEPKET